MDYLTKYPECFATEDQKAETVAKILVEEIICRHGAPIKILTDRGANFLSEVMNQVYQLFHIQKVSTSPYHPQTDGMVERFNSTLLNMLAPFVNEKQDDWDIYLPFLLMAYRTTDHASTIMSPFYLMYGRHPNLPMDIPFQHKELVYMDEITYADQLTKYLEKAWFYARNNILLSQQNYTEQYNKSMNAHKFKVGDFVWVYTPNPKRGITTKLQRLWCGPFEVLKETPQNVTIKRKGKPQIVHVNRCKHGELRPLEIPDKNIEEREDKPAQKQVRFRDPVQEVQEFQDTEQIQEVHDLQDTEQIQEIHDFT